MAKKKDSIKATKTVTTGKPGRKTTSKPPGKKATRKAVTRSPELPSTPPPPTPGQVAEAAYHFYLERLEKGLSGDSQGDWLAAEAALRTR
ncbi:MAG: hypothetical protein GWO24_24490 [Akkermansiaceae bacterium]|nr:hypothetical protein [Akkermansiaceae bacterium]